MELTIKIDIRRVGKGFIAKYKGEDFEQGSTPNQVSVNVGNALKPIICKQLEIALHNEEAAKSAVASGKASGSNRTEA